ncbi:neuropeptide FF receptor 2-like [Stylophora pistillata]|uniref:neuropeptide FF receptor 2-like n=1 Tax=Stylophora pistillata TaxID=50429 RepID=UPI000C0454A9|nr:neuropeptide FF receptor 2-like [Stylophora pistillata]
MSNNTEAMTNSTEQNVTLGFYIAIIITGLVGNSLVIAVISGKKSKRSIYDLFILNLGMADLSFIFFYMPVLIYEEYINSIYKTVYYCRLVQPLLTIFYFLSIFTISSMAIHRCKVITNPHKPKMKKRTGYLWIAAVWLFTFIIVLPLSIVTKSTNGKCDEKWPTLNHRKAYTLALFILQFVIPLQIIAAAYLKIGIYLWRSAAPQSSLSSVKSKRVQRRKKENIQVVKTLALIVILFTVCLLPGQIGYLLWEFGDEEDLATIDIICKFATILDCLHACVNPIVYGLLTERFRREYIRYLSFCLSCGTKQVNTMQETQNAESTIEILSPSTTRRKLTNEDVETIPNALNESQNLDSQITRPSTACSSVLQEPTLIKYVYTATD